MNILELLIELDRRGIEVWRFNGDYLFCGPIPRGKAQKRIMEAFKRHKAVLLPMLRKPEQDGYDLDQLRMGK